MEFAFQGYLKLGQSKEDKLRRVTLQIDISDITFAFKVRAEFLTPVSIPICLFCFCCTN
jgi:cell division control protein 6